jgi:hypothetical protein
MNKPVLTHALIGLLAVNSLLTLLFAWQYKSSFSRLSAVQLQIARHNDGFNRTRTAMQGILRDSAEYAKTHPDLLPILKSLGITVDYGNSKP